MKVILMKQKLNCLNHKDINVESSDHTKNGV